VERVLSGIFTFPPPNRRAEDGAADNPKTGTGEGPGFLLKGWEVWPFISLPYAPAPLFKTNNPFPP